MSRHNYCRLFNSSTAAIAQFPPDQPALVCVVIDTEEEFDWNRPLSSKNASVENLAHQHTIHSVFERYGIRPTYLVDFPVASQSRGFGPLRELVQSDACDIGAHLHPWVNPPFLEQVNNHNSYPGNLEPGLEHEKLRRLTDCISENLDIVPRVYRAGRYGIGPSTVGNLKALGYEVDTSVVPCTDFSDQEGPDFRHCPSEPYWLDNDRALLEVPLTTGFTGLLSSIGTNVYHRLAGPPGVALHLPGIFARTGLLERVRLTPEGVTAREHQRLIRALVARGQPLFVMSYHSPSLKPGNTPYVRSAYDLEIFINRISQTFEFFFETLDARPSTLLEVKQMATSAQQRKFG